MISVFKYFVMLICFCFSDCAKFRCDYNFKEVGWFKYHEIPATWRSARSMCHLEGGILASPTSQELKATMISYVKEIDIFTGIHAIFSPGHYYSVDGIPLSEIPHEWTNLEPDNKNNEEACLTMNYEGKLSDESCEKPRPYVCYRKCSDVDVNICGIDPEYHFSNKTNKCYKIHTKARAFSRAHFACSAEGGHLVIINGKEEATVVKDLFRRSHIKGAISRNHVFIGFHNLGEANDWRTIHGETIEDAGFPEFAPGEPNNADGKENCGTFNRNGALNDYNCDLYAAFICEKEPNSPALCDN